MTEIKNPLKGLTEYGWHFEQEVFLSSGIARTVKSGEGTGNIPKVIEYETKGRSNVQGSLLASLGGGNPSKSFNFFNGGIEDVSVTLLAENHSASVLTKEYMAKIYRIRKLTPRECFRLMGVSDTDISKIQNYPLVMDANGDFYPPDNLQAGDIKKLSISESQQYKMAGNSIVVQVLEGIFTQLFKQDQDTLF